MAVTLKRVTMYRKIIVAVTAIVVSASVLSAQTPNSEFHRYNRWMAGAGFVFDSDGYPGAGIIGIYGRQFSEALLVGVGFGMDTYIGRKEKRYSFVLPVYADLQVNLSHRRSPFFGELKAGAAIDLDKSGLGGGGLLFGAGAGKCFTLRNEDEISVILGVDCILWPSYTNVPVSIGIRYGF